MRILEFLGNASVAAFVGAFAAFMLVAANDWRRRRRKKKLLISLVDDARTLARDKRASVESRLELIQQNKFSDAPIMPFEPAALRNQRHEVLDMLDANQSLGLSAIIYWMESIDGLVDEARRSARLLRYLEESGAPHDQKTVEITRIVSHYMDLKDNLTIFDKLCRYYISGQPHKIRENFHTVSDENDDDS